MILVNGATADSALSSLPLHQIGSCAMHAAEAKGKRSIHEHEGAMELMQHC